MPNFVKSPPLFILSILENLQKNVYKNFFLPSRITPEIRVLIKIVISCGGKNFISPLIKLVTLSDRFNEVSGNKLKI